MFVNNMVLAWVLDFFTDLQKKVPQMDLKMIVLSSQASTLTAKSSALNGLQMNLQFSGPPFQNEKTNPYLCESVMLAVLTGGVDPLSALPDAPLWGYLLLQSQKPYRAVICSICRLLH